MSLPDALREFNAILDAIERNAVRAWYWEQKHYSDLTRLIMSSNSDFFTNLRFNLIAHLSGGWIRKMYRCDLPSLSNCTSFFAYASTTAVLDTHLFRT